MTFDEQLHRAVTTVADRFRDELVRELRLAADQVLAEARAERVRAVQEAAAAARVEAEQRADATVRAAVSEAESRGRAAADRDAREERTAFERRASEMAAAAGAASRDEMRAAALAASERLLEAIRTIDRGRSLSDILDAVVTAASRESARAGVLLVRGDELRGWRFAGFDPAVEPPSSVVVRRDEAGILAEAIRTGSAVLADAEHERTVPAFARVTKEPDGPGARRDRLAVPITIGADVVAVLYAECAERDQLHATDTLTWSATLEVLVRHAGRCLEAATALKAVRTLTGHDLTRTSHSSTSKDDGDRNAPGDRDEGASRYARLLVSEIKLYHEAAVATGRRERDLSTRLAAEIARARGLYEQRVPAEKRGPIDHFQHELVHTLADGDASLLGQHG